MIKRTLSQNQVRDEPWQVWNAFVDILAIEDYNDLGDIQKPAHSIFWYESETQNGGHLQYFLNQGVPNVKLTIEALNFLDAEEHGAVLKSALELYDKLDLSEIEDKEDYIEEALEDHFGALDMKSYAIETSIQSVLENYLGKNKSEFVTIV